jgi:RNA polymerase sigma-70 factor (ECF subfamily)
VSTVCVTDDRDLVARARQGDHAAFGALIDRHGGAALRTARAAIRSPQDAEDAVQDAFVLAYQKLGGFRGEASFKTWLLSIVWRQALNQRRGQMWRRIVRARTDEEDHAVMNTAAAGPTPEEAAAHAALRRAIAAAIRGLSPKLRDALLLAQTGDHTYEEMSVLLGAPVGTVKWRVSEARKLVRQELQVRGHDDV